MTMRIIVVAAASLQTEAGLAGGDQKLLLFSHELVLDARFVIKRIVVLARSRRF
jgi:hypothetical protein